MFNRTAPRALALAFVVVVMVAAAIILVTGAFNTATPGQDGVPAYSYQSGPEGTYNGFPELDTADYGVDIPRCAADDFNADHVARCYTERVTDGAVLILDASDTIIATFNK